MKRYIILGGVLGLIGVVAGYVYASQYNTPTYKSETQFIVLSPKTANQAKDYASIATSRSVLDFVANEIGAKDAAEVTEGTVVKAVNTAGTNIVEISVEAHNPDRARKIANSVARGIAKQAELLYEEDNTKIVDVASEAQMIGDRDPIKTALLGGGVGVVLALAIAFIAYVPHNEESPREEVKQPEVAGGDDPEEGVDTPFPSEEINEVAQDRPVRKVTKPVEIKPVGHKYIAGTKSTRKKW